MKGHYGINNGEFAKLCKTVTLSEMVSHVSKFSPNASEPSVVSMMCYIDLYGDIFEGDSAHKKIAQAIFNSMDNDNKVSLMLYMEDQDGN